MPYALCPMPYERGEVCPTPYALRPMPYALCPMPYAGRNMLLRKAIAFLAKFHNDLLMG
jgi:hypothetical protein